MNVSFFIKRSGGDYEDCFLVGRDSVRVLGRYQHFTSHFTKLHVLQQRRKQSSKGLCLNLFVALVFVNCMNCLQCFINFRIYARGQSTIQFILYIVK